MTPEEKDLLLKTHELVEENNKILRSLRRSRRIGVVMTVLYWALIIGLSIGAFYFVQPWIDFIAGSAESGTQVTDQLKELLK